MKNSTDLIKEKEDLLDKVEAIGLKAEKEDRELSEEENKEVAEAMDKINTLKRDIAYAKTWEDEQAKRAEDKAKKVTPKKTNEDKRLEDMGKYSFLRAAGAAAGLNKLDGIEAEIHKEAELEARKVGIEVQGVGTPSRKKLEDLIGAEKRDLDATNAAAGGNTIQTDVGGLIPYLYPRLKVVQMGAVELRDLEGNLSIPRVSGVVSGTEEGEDDANAESTPTFAALSLSPTRVGAYTEVTKRLLQQSSVDVENWLRGDMMRAISTKIDEYAIDGSGSSNQPRGILNTTGIGDVAGGTNGAAPDWADVVDLETELTQDNADFGKMGYLTTPGVKGYFKKTLKSTGVSGYIWGEGGELNGYNAQVSTQCPSDLTKGSGTSLHAIIFGNWAELIIGYWGGVDLVVDPYSLVKNNKIQLVVNQHYDVGVRHAESFAAMQDASI